MSTTMPKDAPGRMVTLNVSNTNRIDFDATTLGTTVGSYYVALVDQGVPSEIAERLATRLHDQFAGTPPVLITPVTEGGEA